MGKYQIGAERAEVVEVGNDSAIRFLGNEGARVLSNAYPVYTDNAEEKAAAAMARLHSFGIESLGRQGAFDYQPTARDSTVKAEAALRRD